MSQFGNVVRTATLIFLVSMAAKGKAQTEAIKEFNKSFSIRIQKGSGYVRDSAKAGSTFVAATLLNETAVEAKTDPPKKEGGPDPKLKAALDALFDIYSQANSRETREGMSDAELNALLSELNGITHPQVRDSKDWQDAYNMITGELNARNLAQKTAPQEKKPVDSAQQERVDESAQKETVIPANMTQNDSTVVEIKSVGLPSDSIDEIKPMKPLGKSAVTIKEEKAQAPIVKRSTLTEPADTLGSKIEEINAEIGKIEAQVYVKLLGANYALEDSAGVRISDIAFAIGNDTVSLAALALQRERFVQITEENCAWMKGNRKLLDKVSAIADRLNALLPRAPRLDYRVYYVTGKWNSVVGG